jgi:hypothetical protein
MLKQIKPKRAQTSKKLPRFLRLEQVTEHRVIPAKGGATARK